jgi:hypothetical protein
MNRAQRGLAPLLITDNQGPLTSPRSPRPLRCVDRLHCCLSHAWAVALLARMGCHGTTSRHLRDRRRPHFFSLHTPMDPSTPDAIMACCEVSNCTVAQSTRLCPGRRWYLSSGGEATPFPAWFAQPQYACLLDLITSKPEPCLLGPPSALSSVPIIHLHSLSLPSSCAASRSLPFLPYHSHSFGPPSLVDRQEFAYFGGFDLS